MRIRSDFWAAVFCATMWSSVARADFTETYENGSDVGKWVASFSVQRQIQPTGGSPFAGQPLGPYLQQGGFSSSIPTWGTASPHYQPGFNDELKENSPFVGNWTAAGVTTFSVDLDVIQAGSWPAPGRPLTLQLMQMDAATGFDVNYVATFTTLLMPVPPVGWTHYDFTINANGGAVPAGWVFTHGDGSPGSDAEWSTFLSQIDLTTLGYYAPGSGYPSSGSWTLGLDNPTVHTATVPEPGSAALALSGLTIASVTLRRRAK